MSWRRVLGVALFVVGLFAMCQVGAWQVFVVWVWNENRGADREAIRTVVQPLTCLCFLPAGLFFGLGAVLAGLPAPDRDQGWGD
ncbi:MAG: hypothetical protein EP330_01585 [Deltaproteobacteria bacterium]|nr:MAG: hypothetical protein EP330_01585 [Deltaproteobacteria bacterium]